MRKTAAYADLILRELKRENIYTDQLTDTFVSEVVHSAPLHDIGKIQVSDAILNKPGKLTDLEYDIIKSHTTQGGDILRNRILIGKTEDVARSHHERYDGKGYPSGLKGEEIPLSARIMAVADVFDALVSRRSYKEPFSFEEAMRIIQEDSGTRFDPAIVDAFCRAGEEVRRI